MRGEKRKKMIGEERRRMRGENGVDNLLARFRVGNAFSSSARVGNAFSSSARVGNAFSSSTWLEVLRVGYFTVSPWGVY